MLIKSNLSINSVSFCCTTEEEMEVLTSNLSYRFAYMEKDDHQSIKVTMPRDKTIDIELLGNSKYVLSLTKLVRLSLGERISLNHESFDVREVEKNEIKMLAKLVLKMISPTLQFNIDTTLDTEIKRTTFIQELIRQMDEPTFSYKNTKDNLIIKAPEYILSELDSIMELKGKYHHGSANASKIQSLYRDYRTQRNDEMLRLIEEKFDLKTKRITCRLISVNGNNYFKLIPLSIDVIYFYNTQFKKLGLEVSMDSEVGVRLNTPLDIAYKLVKGLPLNTLQANYQDESSQHINSITP